MDSTTYSRRHRFRSVGAFVAGREVVTFFALTLAFSWAIWLPGALGFVDFGSLTLAVVVIGGFSPLVAAALVTWLVGASLRAWAGQLLRWRVHFGWHLAAFVFPVVAFSASIVVYAVLGNPIEQAEAIQQAPIYVLPLIFVLNMVFVFLLGGGQEELGWRGFALPRLLDRVDAVSASLIIGTVWAVWHLPLFVLEGASQFDQPFVPYATSLLALSIVFTWLYRGTGRSVLLAMILHASHNSATVLIPVQPVQTGTVGWLMAAVLWAFALGLVAVYGRDLRSGDSADRETGEDRSPPAA